jgi:2-(1,2-epoxy-1,2-dihydrophenyl)acetyl-CoA isomerase
VTDNISNAYDGVPGLAIRVIDGALHLVLERPEVRNALNDEMVAAMITAIETAGSDEAVRVVVISSTGDHFCSGFDIVARNQQGGAKPRVGSIQRRLPRQAHRLIPVMLETQTPIVCVVRGWAAGIGLNLALAADFTIAADDAKFWAPFVDRGFTPDSGATWMLQERVGVVKARRMLELGQIVSGAEAAEWELIHEAVPADGLGAAVDELTGKLASSATVALGLTKWLLHTARSTSVDEQLRNEAFAMELSSRSDDFREGLSAFKEKRPPDYQGR